jgi:serine/threonine protein kinase
MPADPRRVKDLFVAALDRSDRADFLDRECAGDPDLRHRLDALLAAHDHPESALERPLAATTAFHPRSEAAGTVIAGKYKLLEPIGEGGMGEVWVADQLEPIRRRVALKVIKAGMDSKSVLARFEAERQALALMDHPNIAKVFDAGFVGVPALAGASEDRLKPGLQQDGRPFFAMELVKGTPITDFCDTRRLSPRERLELFVPVCQAIQHAHQKGVIHRDIKPSNVLVALHDEKPVPKVIDFGVAKAVGQQLTEKTLYTGFGALVGTPAYMAPEQATFNQLDVDTRADVYALGVLLYELLAGSPPFEPARLKLAALDEVLRLVREEEPPRPSARLSTSQTRASIAAVRQSDPDQLAKLVRGELDWIVMKALEKDRNRRYETPTGFAADVQRYLAGEPVLAVPPSAGYRLRKFLRRNRGPALAAGALAVAILLAVAGLGWGLVKARRAEADTRHALVRVIDEEQKTRTALEEADRQRQAAETHAASITIDQDLKLCEDEGQRPLGLLRLARTLRTIPDHARELRECVTLNVLCYGQAIAPLVALVPGDGLTVSSDLSPDGRTVLAGEADDRFQLLDALTRQVIATFPAGERVDRVLFTNTGRLVSVGGGGRVVRRWDESGRAVMTSQSFPGPVRFVVLSPDEARVLVIADPKPRDVPHIVEPSEATWVELLDGTTGRRVARLTGITAAVRHAAFSPDGRWVLTGGADLTPRVWSAADGRLAHTLPAHTNWVTWVGFSPDGTHAATLGGDLHWWPVPDARPRDPAGDLRPDSIGIDAYPESVGFIHPDVVCSHQILDLGYHVRTTFRRPVAAPLGDLGGIASDGALVLTPEGAVHDLTAGGSRRLPPPGRRYHPEAMRLNGGRRLLIPQVPLAYSQLIDLAAEKVVGPYGDYRRVTADGVAAVSVGILLPAPDIDLPADVLELWAQVTVRGELGPDGTLVKWDEPTWERKRRELAARARPVGAFPFPGEVARDRLYWLRQQARESGDRPEAISLLERLVAAEPTAAHYLRLAEVRFKAGQLEPAIRDVLTAEERVGGRVWGWRSLSDWRLNLVQVILRRRDLPAAAYQMVERHADVFGVNRSGEEPGAARLRAWAAYRLGRYDEVCRYVSHDEARRAGTCAALLASPWAVAGLPRFGFPLTVESDALKVMAFHRLGQTAIARARLERLRQAIREFHRTAPESALSVDEQAAVEEAEDLVAGRSK